MQVGVYSFQFYKMTYTSNFSVRVDIYLKISQFFFNVAIMFRVALNPLVFAKWEQRLGKLHFVCARIRFLKDTCPSFGHNLIAKQNEQAVCFVL